MITVKPLHDPAALRVILGDASVWEYIRPDDVPLTDELVHRILRAGPVLGVYDDDELGGAFCFTMFNAAVYEIHTCLLPSCRGEKAIEAARRSVLWLFAINPAQKYIS